MTDVRIPVYDLELAWCRFQGFWPHKDTCDWNDFLTCRVMCTSDREGYWATPEGAAKIAILNGPHWKTMLKVWSIRYRGQLNEKHKRTSIRGNA